jgi:DNA mismatch repair ATPase MutS
MYVPFTTYIKTMFYSVFNSSETLLGNNKFFKYVRIISYVFSAVFYFQGIFTSIDISKTVNKMCSLIISNFNSVIDYLSASKRLIDIYWNDSTISSYVNIDNILNDKNDVSQEIEKKFVEDLKVMKQDYSIFNNFGNQLKTYKNINTNIVSHIVRKSYILDCLIGTITYKSSRGLCITEYIDEGKPVIEFTKMIHPCIDSSKAVENDIYFGVNDNEQNAIITSPNSSGKSILIKSIILNVIMSQTMGICCCKYAKITPFRFINTQINVPDSTGHESLFEAEMHRCKYTLDKLRSVNSDSLMNKYSLIVMDEIFNSTNPLEAVSGAYAVCKKMTNFQSTILIFTTHFNYLTKLAKEPQCKFVNYRMETYHNQLNNDIRFTYKLERGVNKHLLALELLRKSGFEDDILEDAINIKNRLTSKQKN